MSHNNINKVSALIKESKALIVFAGAGMGVDSGLPDFRSKDGFWRAYPLYAKLNMSFYEAANPQTFLEDPYFAWGFYGHRLNMYREVQPHQGFYYINNWVKKLGLSFFVVTSNVDGHFQKSGVPEGHIYEVHGSIHYLQCVKPCRETIWKNNFNIEVDFNTMRARNIPTCKYCGDVARPNILMFGDFSWVSLRADEQSERFNRYIDSTRSNDVVILEIGAGKAVPTIRYLAKRAADIRDATIVRINPVEFEIEKPHISIKGKALDVLSLINEYIK